jgi:hypothetical protein
MELSEVLKKMRPTFTDFAKNELVFRDAFGQNEVCGYPIKKVLELGVCRINTHVPPDFFGQSTKTLIALCAYYGCDLLISIDIDPLAAATVERCRQFLKDCGHGHNFEKHYFVEANSLEYEVDGEFDFIFLDTNHDDNYPERIGVAGKEAGGAGTTYREICKYANVLSEGGRLFIHDTKNFYVPRGYGVNTEGAIQKFLDENPDDFKFREHNTNKNGLGEIVRADNDIWDKFPMESY